MAVAYYEFNYHKAGRKPQLVPPLLNFKNGSSATINVSEYQLAGTLNPIASNSKII